MNFDPQNGSLDSHCVSKIEETAVTRLPPNAGKGRPKGTLNKSTASIKAALTEAFENLGGVDALTAWGRSNPSDFYKLCGRLIPTELHASGPNDGAIELSAQSAAAKISAIMEGVARRVPLAIGRDEA